MLILRRLALPAAAFAALLGCGGNVTIDNPPGATGTGGEGGSVETTSGSGGEGTTGNYCGGKQGLACPGTEWCQYPADSVCGCCDMTGVCTPKPLDCPFDCPGVCGCDGKAYCNECLANLAGFGVDSSQDCSMPPPYSLRMLPTNVPRFMLFRSDGYTCTRVMASTAGGFMPYSVNVTPPWNIEQVVITNNALDCKVGNDGMPVPPKDQVVVADTAIGTLTVDMPDVPCGVDANLTITFPKGQMWIPASIPFVTGYLSTGLPCDL